MKPFSLLASLIFAVLMTLTGVSAARAEPEVFAPERVGSIYWYLGGGAYHPESNAQLSNQEGRFGIVAGLGYRYSRWLAWEAGLLDGYQKMDTPPGILPAGYGTLFQGTVDPQASLSTSGVTVTARFIYPLGRLEPYAGGGIGIYKIELRATGQQLGFPTEASYGATELGWHMLAGADVHLTEKTSLGVEFRRCKVSADLGSVVPGRVEAGGDFISLMLRGHFAAFGS